MSVFAPIDVRAPLARKQQLLQTLMQQYQSAAQRVAGLARGGGLSGMGASALARPASVGGGGIPGGLFTSAGPTLSSVLQSMLGPGGVGHPIAGRDAMPNGMPLPVARPVGFGASPATASIGVPMPVQLPALGGSVSAPQSAPLAQPGANGPAVSANVGIPLAAGAVYDPVSGAIVLPRAGGTTAPAPGGAVHSAVAS